MKTPTVGQFLFDIHNSFSDEFIDYDERKWKVVENSWKIIRSSGGSQIIENYWAYNEVYKKYTNKFLVIVDDSSFEEEKTVTAMYSYDDLRFGIMTLELID